MANSAVPRQTPDSHSMTGGRRDPVMAGTAGLLPATHFEAAGKDYPPRFRSGRNRKAALRRPFPSSRFLFWFRRPPAPAQQWA